MGNQLVSIFLLSSERSGSNLIRHRICNFAEHICSVPPVSLLRTFGYWEPLMGPFSEDDKWCRLIRYTLRCCYERAVPWDIEFDHEIIANVYERTYGKERTLVRLADILYRQYAECKGYSGYFNKEIRLFDFAETIAHQLPHAKFIHLYRDPRDYVLSQKKRPYGNQSALYLANLWKEECNASLKAVNNPIIKDKSFSISYEFFLNNENEILNEIAEKFSLRLNCTSDNHEQKVFEKEFHELKNVHRTTMRNNFNKYLTLMKRSEIRIIESVCWNTMRFLGYTTEHKKQPKISIIYRILYQIMAYMKTKLKHIVNRYRLRDEPINRSATASLVKDLTAKYR